MVLTLVLFKLVKQFAMTSLNVLSDTFVPTSLWTPILHALVHLRIVSKYFLILLHYLLYLFFRIHYLFWSLAGSGSVSLLICGFCLFDITNLLLRV